VNFKSENGYIINLPSAPSILSGAALNRTVLFGHRSLQLDIKITLFKCREKLKNLQLDLIHCD